MSFWIVQTDQSFTGNEHANVQLLILELKSVDIDTGRTATEKSKY
jgi:hypothetical protein